jgi:hypothetical protein
MLERTSVCAVNATEADAAFNKGAGQRNSRDSESGSGCLDLCLYGAGLGDLMAGIGMHAKHCEKCLAAVVSQKNAKGESGKYSTGKS